MPIFRMPVVLHANYPHANCPHANYPNANCPSTVLKRDIGRAVIHSDDKNHHLEICVFELLVGGLFDISAGQKQNKHFVLF